MIPERLARPMPKPARIHWGFILLLQIVTLGLFSMVWLIVQANWSRKARGSSKALWWAIINACMLPSLILCLVIEAAVGVPPNGDVMHAITALFRLGIIVTNLGAVFVLRSELENSPINIPLSGVLTFFLGIIYFQYHLYDYDVEGKVVPEGSLGLTS